MSAKTKQYLSVLFMGSTMFLHMSCSSPDSSLNVAASGTTIPSTTSPNTTSQNATSQQVAALTFSPAAGTYASSQTVTISTTTLGASIRYTTDGSTPTETFGIMYSEPIGVQTTETINAIAYKTGLTDSTIATAVYSIGGTISTPSFSPPEGTYSSNQTVTISCATAGAAIHYTVDGSTPTSSSSLYTEPIRVSGNGTNETIKAVGTETGMTDSSVETAVYVISYAKILAPTFNPIAGAYSSDQSVTISGTSGATIHYTTDGTTPTISSALYNASISVAGDGTIETIKAIATGNKSSASSVATAIYSIDYKWQSFGAIGSGANQLRYPTGVTIDAKGQVYVVDRGNNRIVRMDNMNGTAWKAFGEKGSGTNQFKDPTGVAIDAVGHIYVVDQGNNRIVRMDDMSASGWVAFGNFGSGTNQFAIPAGVTIDANGHIYVIDQGNNRIVRMDDMNGTGWKAFGEKGSGTNQFRDPAGVALDASGHIYIADYANSRIVRIDDMDGINWSSLGSSGLSNNQFEHPTGIAIDASGHIYVADMINDRIARMDDMQGTKWTTLASAHQFNHPWGVDVDAIGQIYVADMLNNRIVRFILP